MVHACTAYRAQASKIFARLACPRLARQRASVFQGTWKISRGRSAGTSEAYYAENPKNDSAQGQKSLKKKGVLKTAWACLRGPVNLIADYQKAKRNFKRPAVQDEFDLRY